MVKVAALGPERSQTWQAAGSYLPQAEIVLYPDTDKVIDALAHGETDLPFCPFIIPEKAALRIFRPLNICGGDIGLIILSYPFSSPSAAWSGWSRLRSL